MQNPIELTLLIWLMVLAASLWIPFVVGANLSPARNADFTRPLDPSVHPAWTHRAWRAHLNLLEQAVPFAALTLVVDRLDGFTALTAATSIAFLVLRLAHAAGMISGVAGFPVRPMIFTAGWLCCLLMAYAALSA